MTLAPVDSQALGFIHSSRIRCFEKEILRRPEDIF